MTSTTHGGPFTVPGRRSLLQVNESAPYRFDGQRGAHEFSGDVLAYARGDREAGNRLNRFVSEVFVSSANVPGLTPTISAEYLPENRFAAPIWSAITKPAPFDGPTPFVPPAFATGGNLVDDTRTEGTEPAAATLTTAGGTITPTSVMGHVDLNRELFDQTVINPAASAAMWTEMVRSYDEALEARAAAALNAIASPTTIALTPASTGTTLVGALRTAVVGLAFTRGGIRDGFASVNLYTPLATAVDANGQRLLTDAPTDGDQADGVLVNVRAIRASWALGTGSSYMLDRRYVHGWATPPRELRMDRTHGSVSKCLLGLVGYAAVHVARPAYVRKITY